MTGTYSTPIAVTSQFYFCPMPLRMDTYSGCTNNCLYCFANNSQQKYINDKGSLKLANLHNSDFVKPTTVKKVKKYLDIAFEGAKNTFSNQEACAIEAIKRRIPIHWGGMSDGFQPKERTSKVSLECLKLLKKYNYPVIISTKCHLITEPEYYEVLKDYKNAGIQVSLIDDRQEVMDILEPGVGKNSVADRLNIFEVYKDKWTACRIQPVIIDLTENNIPSLIKKLAERNVNHVMAEGLKFFSGNKHANAVIGNAFKKITGKTFDLVAHYKSIGGKFSGNDIELPSWRKKVYIDTIKKELKKYPGMTFGAADNDFRMEGDNPCCCGNKDMPGMANVCKHNIGFAAFRAREQNVPITYELIKDEWFWEGDYRHVISTATLDKRYGVGNWGQDKRNIPLIDSFMKQWKKAGKNSPCQMCNVENCPSKLDKEGLPTYNFKTQTQMDYLLKPIKQQKLSDLFGAAENDLFGLPDKIPMKSPIDDIDKNQWIKDNYGDIPEALAEKLIKHKFGE